MDVYLEDGDEPLVRHRTRAVTVEDFLEEIEIILNESDELNVPLDEFLKNEMKISIVRGFTVQVLLNGEETELWAKENDTIGDIIEMLWEKTGVRYFCNSSDDVRVSKGSKFELISERFEVVSINLPIPFGIIYKEDFDLAEGAEVILIEGAAGLRRVLFNVRYFGEKEDYREVISNEIITEPVSRVISRGAVKAGPNTLSAAITDPLVLAESERAPLDLAGTEPADEDAEATEDIEIIDETEIDSDEPAEEEDPENILYIDDEEHIYIVEFTMSASAYTAASTGRSPDSKSYGITAMGIRAVRGIVAVDPTVIPLGSELYIEGYGFAVAADTGPSIKGSKIDLYYETLAEAKQFGRRNLKVYMLRLP